ncbi:phosphatidate cytidylyltransferase [Methylobacterium sp. W2]|uniref:phosphatidate cytidylyltransferase n=1 Tax=Methylobacterium sp. W2 TaxID=2598107 RepID=UPI001D0CB8D2|nr:phosphatidate cytidylyltransferase [Methylobacterium sp. W2]MCC0806689.1 phosphatidate cytidylyltransferase [Methylobacterium sp. W2]
MVSPGDAASAPRRGPLGGREFQLRTASAIVLATIVLTTLFLGGWAFAAIWLIAGIVFAGEWITISRIAPLRLTVALTGLGLAGLALCLRLDASLPIWLAVTIAALVALLVTVRDSGGRGRVVIGFLSAAVLVLVPPALRDDPAIGIFGPAWMFAVVWSTDIVAYITGRTFGGPKLMPSVSPKKTWSGSLGGLAAGIAAGTLLAMAARSQGWSSLADAPLAVVALTAAAASILSQAGDLAESALKRHYGVKDSGRSIPGHGGVMDRLDGFFAVAVLAGLYLIAHRYAVV